MNLPFRPPAPRMLLLLCFGGTLAFTAATATQRRGFQPRVTPEETGCTPEERRAALQAMQEQVLAAVPDRVDSLEKAVQPGGPLAGWSLSHGYVVLASSGAVGVDNIKARDPLPQLLLYEPSPTSQPRDWLDFSGPDNPYRLIGWAYIGPYQPGAKPPSRHCIAPSEWFVHEAGWHLKDGDMQLTPGARTEPPRPPGLDVLLWHPQVWDVHVWRGGEGVPTISFTNPNERTGGLALPDEAFYYLVEGKKRLPVVTEPSAQHSRERGRAR